MNFCIECAAPLRNRCPNCGFENPPVAKFCGQCATPLARQTPVAKSTQRDIQLDKQKDMARSEGERRQLTVMFCDLVGSTSLSEKFDPEDLRDIVRSYQETCAEVIENYDGYVAQYLGDGLLVYFGYPLAHEDDAQRAVRAGLEIVGAVGAMSFASSARPTTRTTHESPLQSRLNQSLQLRIGIHTGLVVAGEMGGGKRRDPMAIVGETPNIAARLQGLAEPNTVVISAATYRLVEGLFEYKSLGTQPLKGISTPIDVYQVLGASGVHSRFEVAIAKGLTPLIGREHEVDILHERWEQAKKRKGQMVLISGEPGIGKSRLVQVLKERLAEEPHTKIESRCSPFYQNTALYPIIEHLKRFLFKEDDTSEEKLARLEGVLDRYRFSLNETVPLFATLLSLPFSDRYPPLTMTPQRQKQKTMEALLTWLRKEAEKQPVLRIVEDLHWVDPSTLDYLSLLVEQIPTAPILTILTFRPDFKSPWARRSHMAEIVLDRLTQKQVELMVNRISEGINLPAEVLQQIVAKTDGVPLFVEELTKMVMESGVPKARLGETPLSIPTTLYDSLMARLDRLTNVKEVAQFGATLGRDFNFDLMQAVSPLDQNTLLRELSKLVEAELLYQKGLPPNASYIFKHALIQDAAYQSLLKSKRQQYHGKIAQVLEERFLDTVETQPELLAHHYTEGGLIAQAIPYWQKAGEKARRRSANIEAIGHLTKGLQLLETLTDAHERAQQELDLQTTLGPALVATKGYAALEVEKAYTRARELCQQVGETPQLFPVLWGLWNFYLGRAQCRTARTLAEQLLTVAKSVRDLALILYAHDALGQTLYSMGEFTSARAHLEEGTTLYDPQRHRSLAFLYGEEDSGVACQGFAAMTLWFLGYPDQSLARMRGALTLAQELSNPHSLAFALFFATWLDQVRRVAQLDKERAEVLITLSSEQGFSLWLAGGTILRAWALVEQGQESEGMAQIREGIDDWRATGQEWTRPYFLALLADAHGKLGQTKEGLTVVEEALDVVDNSGERCLEAELYRLQGELLLQKAKDGRQKLELDNPFSTILASEEAENCFREAIEVARRQNAKSLELRAVMSLGRLWQKQGKKKEARQMISEIYDWFTEGFDTRDLREAKALLEDLQ